MSEMPAVVVTSAPEHETDPERKRSTYGVRYPKDDLILDSKGQLERLVSETPTDPRKTVTAKRLTLSLVFRTLPPTVFRECNFHNMKGAGLASIKKISFSECTFDRCIMGTTHYSGIRFRDCVFKSCDFANAIFEECLFERCSFQKCTAAGAKFVKTEIDPEAFLKSIGCPSDNYAAASPDDKEKAEIEFLDIRYRLAAELLRSNNEIVHTEFADKGLLMFKKAELEVAKDKWRRRATGVLEGKCGWLAWVRLQLKGINVSLTNGGTSLFKLGVLMVLLIILLAFLMGFLGVEYGDCGELAFGGSLWASFKTYLKLLAPAASLFLGFGFTNLKIDSAQSAAFATAAAMVGLVWFALVIPVMIRKIYR